MTIKEEARAELASNPKAKLFICSVPCLRCGCHERYIETTECTSCKQVRNRTARMRRGSPSVKQVNSASDERMEQAVIIYTTTELSLGEVASIAGVGSHRLSCELKRQGITLRNPRPRDFSKPPVNPRQDEFNEARVGMMASKLMNDWYRSAHG